MSIQRRFVGTRIGRRGLAAVAWLVVATSACSPDATDAGSLPQDVLDPDVMESLAGAVAAYNGTFQAFGIALGGYSPPPGWYGGASGSFIAATGLLSDELQAGDIGAPVGTKAIGTDLDSRNLPEYTDPSVERSPLYGSAYGSLQRVRGQAREALGLLGTYAPDSSALTGHLYAAIGYAETYLAELYCSGIPLSTVEYGGNYTLRPGSPTDEVYGHAIAAFDSALALAGGRERVVGLASIGRARALLGLGRFAEAGAAVAGIPDGFRYLATYGTAQLWDRNLGYSFGVWFATAADHEGSNGLDYSSSGDPRTVSTPNGGTNMYGVILRRPDQYASDGASPIVVADWVEARLIEAEAALAAGDPGAWLGKLNHLRATAIVPALPDTTDPVDPAARLDLQFRERAFWLYMTGHRLGDMRRLVRHYGRTAESVFPRGSYTGETGTYGTEVTAPVPADERAFNPNFTGCQNRGA
jgi:hypothetical protein